MTVYKHERVSPLGKPVNLVDSVENGEEVYFVKCTGDFDPQMFTNRVVNFENSSKFSYDDQTYSMKVNKINTSIIYVVSTKKDCYEMMSFRPIGIVTMSKDNDFKGRKIEKKIDDEIHPLFDEVNCDQKKLRKTDTWGYSLPDFQCDIKETDERYLEHDNISLPGTYYVMSDTDEQKSVKNHQLEIISLDSDASVFQNFNKKYQKKEKNHLVDDFAMTESSISVTPKSKKKESKKCLKNFADVTEIGNISLDSEASSYKNFSKDLKKKKKERKSKKIQTCDNPDFNETKNKEGKSSSFESEVDSFSLGESEIFVQNKEENSVSHKKKKPKKVDSYLSTENDGSLSENCNKKKKKKMKNFDKELSEQRTDQNLEEKLSIPDCKIRDDENMYTEQTDKLIPEIYCDISDFHSNENKKPKKKKSHKEANLITSLDQNCGESSNTIGGKAEDSKELGSSDVKKKKKKSKKSEKDTLDYTSDGSDGPNVEQEINKNTMDSEKKKKSKKSKIKDTDSIDKDALEVSLPEIESLLSYLFVNDDKKAKNKSEEDNKLSQTDSIVDKNKKTKKKEKPLEVHSEDKIELEDTTAKESKKTKKKEAHSKNLASLKPEIEGLFSAENKRKTKTKSHTQEETRGPEEFDSSLTDTSVNDSKTRRKRKLTKNDSAIDFNMEDDISSKEKRKGDIGQLDSDISKVFSAISNLDEIEIVLAKKRKKKKTY